MTEKCVIDLDDDESAALSKAVTDSLKLDAEGCRIAAAVARAMVAYGEWEPLEPGFGYLDRADIGEQHAAFGRIYEALGDHELGPRILPLLEARQKYQEEHKADEAAAADQERRAKRRHHRKQGRQGTTVLKLVPRPDGEDDPSGAP